MSISINVDCLQCLIGKHLANAREFDDEKTAMAFSKAMLSILANADPEDNSSVLGARINKLYTEYFGLPQDRFLSEKDASNRFVMERMEMLRQRVRQASDPVLTGLQYAILGNYIDFSALGKNVSFDTLEAMLETPDRFAFEGNAYEEFCRDLENAKKMLYVTDNAGELGFDWVLAEELVRRYPNLQITFCVRGFPAHNDATRTDYEYMGIPFPVIDSGSDIGGTDLKYVNRQTRDAIENADLVLAKGMGNTETLWGCGYRIYYAFLVKCKRFQQVFGKPHMTPMFVQEQYRSHEGHTF